MYTQNLKDILGLKDGMSTYFAHAPAEYFELIGHKTFAYRPDEDGTYQFIHAFFTEKEQLEASFGILASKLADDGILWVSVPTENSDIDRKFINSLAENNYLKPNKDCQFENWQAYQFEVNQ